VLFLDGHVGFEKRSYCATEDDNIYTRSSTDDKQAKYQYLTGTPPKGVGDTIAPRNRQDSLLVNENDGTASTPPRNSDVR